MPEALADIIVALIAKRWGGDTGFRNHILARWGIPVEEPVAEKKQDDSLINKWEVYFQSKGM